MCGRYVQTIEYERIQLKFNVAIPQGFEILPNYNVSAGDEGLVITSENPGFLDKMTFGFTPSWSKKKSYVINARAEGDHNSENHPDYRGAKGIISKPFFKQSIRNKRCLVLADAFIEGTTVDKLSNPYLVYLINKNRPFAMAGVYDEWVDKETGELLRSFAIITCPPNGLMQKLPHHRMPVILKPEDYATYLDTSTPLQNVTALLEPYDAKLMNAYPISADIKNPRNKGRELIDPTGERIQEEIYLQKNVSLKLEGMGHTNSRKKRNQP